MMVSVRNLPLVAVVGTTASGKTELGVRLAKCLGGEVISADSRAIYRGLDVGTAKPTLAEMSGVPHWGIDIVNLDNKFTVADFQKYAQQKIHEIRQRGHVPILVGGSGLYIDSVVFGYHFADNGNVKMRGQLKDKSVPELQKIITEHGILMPENSKNPRYLTRAIEKNMTATDDNITTSNRYRLLNNVIVVGISLDKKIIRCRIDKRIHEMFANVDLANETYNGFLAYAPNFMRKIEQKTWSKQDFRQLPEALKSNVYLYKLREMSGELTRAQAEKLAAIDDWHLAKKQLTWFRRNPYISWLTADGAVEFLMGKIRDLRDV